MTNDKEVKKEITKEGVRLTHPSGVVQVLSSERLNVLKAMLEGREAEVEQSIAELEKDIDAVGKKA